MHLVVCVLSAVDKCPDVLDAWEEAGVSGITILESTGMGQIRRQPVRGDRYGLQRQRLRSPQLGLPGHVAGGFAGLQVDKGPLGAVGDEPEAHRLVLPTQQLDHAVAPPLELDDHRADLVLRPLQRLERRLDRIGEVRPDRQLSGDRPYGTFARARILTCSHQLDEDVDG